MAQVEKPCESWARCVPLTAVSSASTGRCALLGRLCYGQLIPALAGWQVQHCAVGDRFPTDGSCQSVLRTSTVEGPYPAALLVAIYNTVGSLKSNAI